MITLGVLVWLHLFSVEENAPEDVEKDIEESKARNDSITNDETFLAKGGRLTFPHQEFVY